MIRLREATERHARHGAGLAAVVLVALVLLLAHSAPSGHEMPEGEIGTAMGICLAVLQSGGVALIGLGLLSAIRRARPSFAPDRLPSAPVFRTPPPAPALPRAGPAELQVFLR